MSDDVLVPLTVTQLDWIISVREEYVDRPDNLLTILENAMEDALARRNIDE